MYIYAREIAETKLVADTVYMRHKLISEKLQFDTGMISRKNQEARIQFAFHLSSKVVSPQSLHGNAFLRASINSRLAEKCNFSG